MEYAGPTIKSTHRVWSYTEPSNPNAIISDYSPANLLCSASWAKGERQGRLYTDWQALYIRCRLLASWRIFRRQSIVDNFSFPRSDDPDPILYIEFLSVAAQRFHGIIKRWAQHTRAQDMLPILLNFGASPWLILARSWQMMRSMWKRPADCSCSTFFRNMTTATCQCDPFRVTRSKASFMTIWWSFVGSRWSTVAPFRLTSREKLVFVPRL